MKTGYFICLQIISLLVVLPFLAGCHQDPTLPLSAYLQSGRYDWIKTTTPSRTIMPQTIGYDEDMTLYSDSKGDYITFYRNDKLYYLADVLPNYPVERDNKSNSLLYQLGSSGFIKFYLTFNANNQVESISTSTIMKTYSEAADTVRTYYVLTHLEPRKR